MFAFGTSRLISQTALFAAEPNSMFIIAVVLVLVAFIFRRRRRRALKAGQCSRSLWFPWKPVLLIVLIVVAWRHFHAPRFTWNWDLDEEIRAVQAATSSGDFPAIKQQELWALRRSAEAAREERDRDRDHAAKPKSVKATRTAKSVVASVVSSTPKKADPAEAYSKKEDLISPHVARTVAQAQELTTRALDHAREIVADTGREVAALKALTALKFVVDPASPAPAKPPKASEAKQEPAPAASVAVIESTATLAAPEAPEHSPAVAFKFPTAPATPATAEPAAKSTSVRPVVRERVPEKTKVLVSSSEMARAESESKPTVPTTPATKRPDWIDHPDGRTGDIYYETVMVERYATRGEAEDALAKETQERTKAYVDRYLGEGASMLFIVPPAYVHDHLVKERYAEPVETSVGPMINAYARLAFDRRAQAQLRRMHRDAEIENRLLGVAGGAVAVMLVLGSVFGYLKLDTLTRGYYTRRLQLAAGVVILAVAALGTRFVLPLVSEKAKTPPRVIELPIDVTRAPTT
ncbi:MAG TPA: hypothetical protein VGN12_14980 [Pirellulales bacterium]